MLLMETVPAYMALRSEGYEFEDQCNTTLWQDMNRSQFQNLVVHYVFPDGISHNCSSETNATQHKFPTNQAKNWLKISTIHQ